MNALFDSFSFLSWLSEASQIEIVDEENVVLEDSKPYKIYTFTSKKSRYPKYLVEISKEECTKTINYCLLDEFHGEEASKYLK